MQCLPIFCMSLSCQTQMFEVYESLPNQSVEKMNRIVKAATNICTGVYILVGVFGYVAYSGQQFSGNILLSFSPSLVSEIIKLGFVLSVAFSFPLVIFPCRASLYSMIYHRVSEAYLSSSLRDFLNYFSFVSSHIPSCPITFPNIVSNTLQSRLCCLHSSSAF